MKLEWHTEKRRISDLIPWERNPRRMTKKQAEDLKKSLERLNLMSIPVIDADNKIVSGHMRIKTLFALDRGDEIIDVRVPNRKLTDEEFAEANLRENANMGEWDESLLASFDEDLLEVVGFDEKKMDEIYGLFRNEKTIDLHDPEFEDKDPIVKLHLFCDRKSYGDISQKLENIKSEHPDLQWVRLE